MGRWVFGAGLMALVAFAHAQPAGRSQVGAQVEAQSGGGFQRTPMMRQAPTGAPRAGMPWAGREAGPYASGHRAGNGGAGRYGAAPVRVGDRGNWRERGGRGVRGGNDVQPERASGGGYGTGPITPVSEQMRAVPHPPADSPVRAGSIREDVARYNEERGSFRPLPRNGGEVPRPPMPSPYRN